MYSHGNLLNKFKLKNGACLLGLATLIAATFSHLTYADAKIHDVKIEKIPDIDKDWEEISKYKLTSPAEANYRGVGQTTGKVFTLELKRYYAFEDQFIAILEDHETKTISFGWVTRENSKNPNGFDWHALGVSKMGISFSIDPVGRLNWNIDRKGRGVSMTLRTSQVRMNNVSNEDERKWRWETVEFKDVTRSILSDSLTPARWENSKNKLEMTIAAPMVSRGEKHVVDGSGSVLNIEEKSPGVFRLTTAHRLFPGIYAVYTQKSSSTENEGVEVPTALLFQTKGYPSSWFRAPKISDERIVSVEIKGEFDGCSAPSVAFEAKDLKD